MTAPNHTFYSPRIALAVVIANMIGTGVFTSLGYQLLNIESGFALMMLWALGGVAALCGALCYGELGAALRRSGGEYALLAHIYHPLIGFGAGFVSATIGFAAPVALAAMAFADYAVTILAVDAPGGTRRGLALALILALTFVHAGRRAASGGLQFVFTLIKLAVIALFCIAAPIAVSAVQPMNFLPAPQDANVLMSSAFAVSLVYVGYAYTGWNAAAYITGELQSPQRDLPRILIFATLIVTLAYLALNAVFLLTAPMDAMRGETEIGYIVAAEAFGTTGGRLAGLVLAGLLISTVSAMMLAGPRVLKAMGEDYPAFSFLARVNADQIPARAVWLQGAIAMIFVLTSTFEAVLVFSGFILALMSFLTVLGLIVLRVRDPELQRPFKVPLYPLVPLVYLFITGWTLVFVLKGRPIEALAGLALFAAGLVIGALVQRFGPR